jgi:hypothetical protein
MGETDPKVSVIINARNGEATLRETLVSVLAQTERDFEIVFWDDGSTDSTAAIATEFAQHAAQSCRGLRYFRGQGGRGLGAARSLALAEARGRWVAFVDQDDLWLPHKLQWQLALGEADDEVGLVYGRTLAFAASGRQQDYDHRHEFQPLPEGHIFQQLWTASCFIAVSSTLMRRSMVQPLLPIPEEYVVSPDYYLYLGLAHAHRTRAVQQVVCRYRLHALSMSHRVRGRIQIEVLHLIERWQHALEPSLSKKRRQVHSTVLAVQEMRMPGQWLTGLRRLLREGSVPYLMARPVAWAGRALRRRLIKPQWRLQG